MTPATNQILYAVTAEFPKAELAREYVDWLTGGHVQAVINGGASAARIVQMQAEAGAGPWIEVQYVFPSQAALDRYVRDCAPALRQEGVERFARRGVIFTRRIGQILHQT